MRSAMAVDFSNAGAEAGNVPKSPGMRIAISLMIAFQSSVRIGL